MARMFVPGRGEAMRDNSKASGRFELSLDARKVAGVLAGSLVLLGMAFALGSSYGAKAVRLPAAATLKDPLARLDEPIAAPPREDESLRAHEALTAPRAEALPVVKPAAAAIERPTAAAAGVGGSGAEPPVPPREAGGRSRSEPAPKAPPPATKSKGATAVAARHGYTIQVASVAHRADAEKVARRHKGRHARVVAADVPGKGRVWRVLVGSYSSRDAASRGLAALGERGYITAMR
jgi:DedD protein